MIQNSDSCCRQGAQDLGTAGAWPSLALDRGANAVVDCNNAYVRHVYANSFFIPNQPTNQPTQLTVNQAAGVAVNAE
jgi:hypothetical protein